MFVTGLLNLEKCRVSNNWNYPDIISPFYRIYFALDGEASVFSNNTCYILKPGFMYLIPAFTRNSYLCKFFFEHIYIHFTIKPACEFPEFSENSQIRNYKILKNDLFLVERILELNPNKALPSYEPKTYNGFSNYKRTGGKKKNRSAEMETHGILIQILSRFISGESYKPADIIPVKIQMVLRYIHENLDKKISVAKLADIICLSPDYFSKLFVKYFKITPVEYINKKRIEKSQLLLVTTPGSIKQIGYDCGYENMAYFYRQFKKICRCTPKEYQEFHQWI